MKKYSPPFMVTVWATWPPGGDIPGLPHALGKVTVDGPFALADDRVVAGAEDLEAGVVRPGSAG